MKFIRTFLFGIHSRAILLIIEYILSTLTLISSCCKSSQGITEAFFSHAVIIALVIVPYVACGRFIPVFRKFKTPKNRTGITYRLVKKRITDSAAQGMIFTSNK